MLLDIPALGAIDLSCVGFVSYIDEDSITEDRFYNIVISGFRLQINDRLFSREEFMEVLGNHRITMQNENRRSL